MSHTEDLKNLDRVIRDAEIRIRTLKTSIEAIDKEVANITALKQTLESNVKCLKTKKVIAVATEYKKAKEELKRVKLRIDTLGRDKIHFCGVLKDVEILLKRSMVDFNKTKDMGENNVLQFPGKKDG